MGQSDSTRAAHLKYSTFIILLYVSTAHCGATVTHGQSPCEREKAAALPHRQVRRSDWDQMIKTDLESRKFKRNQCFIGRSSVQTTQLCRAKSCSESELDWKQEPKEKQANSEQFSGNQALHFASRPWPPLKSVWEGSKETKYGEESKFVASAPIQGCIPWHRLLFGLLFARCEHQCGEMMLFVLVQRQNSEKLNKIQLCNELNCSWGFTRCLDIRKWLL